jgi:uncharacterized protein (DUF1330 family)
MTTYERLTPTDMQLSAFAQGPLDEPVVLVDLLRFRARAAYPRDYEGPKADVSGGEAFRRFFEVAKRCIEAQGGNIVWGAPAFLTIVGPPNERWDEIMVVSFPNRKAFLKLQSDPVYEAALVHWTAALAETRIFACKME